MLETASDLNAYVLKWKRINTETRAILCVQPLTTGLNGLGELENK